MLCVDSSRLCMSGLSLCDLCLCYSILGSQFSNKYLLTYYNFVADSFHTKNCESARVNKDGTCKRNDATAVSTREHRGLCHCQQYAMCAAHYEYAGVRTQVQCMPSAWHGINNLACIKRAQHAASDPVMTDTHCDPNGSRPTYQNYQLLTVLFFIRHKYPSEVISPVFITDICWTTANSSLTVDALPLLFHFRLNRTCFFHISLHRSYSHILSARLSRMAVDFNTGM